MFILADQRETAADAASAFRLYEAYLRRNAASFPPRALELASSSWYHDFSDHRCPHDAWLEELRIREVGRGERQAERSVAITIRLLGAHHDGHIEFRYHDVAGYQCDFARSPTGGDAGHADWRYDELRLSDNGGLLHEIEWWHLSQTGRWVIEAGDVEFRWLPLDGSAAIFDGR